MTELCVAAALAIAGAALILTQDPGAFLKVLVWGSALASLLLHIAGRAVTAPARLRMATAEVLHDWWPLIALAAFIIGGGLYARLAEDIKETFLGFGIGMVFLPLMAIAVRASARPFLLLKALAAAYALAVLGMIALLGFGRGPFHEEIFIAVPLGAYFLCARPLRAWQALLGFALVGGCLLSVKNTTFLLVLTVLAACCVVWIARVVSTGRDGLRVVTSVYFAALALTGIAVALVVTYLRFRASLPTGSPEYRLEMYGIAWRRFLDSPVWGTAFADSAVTYFELYRVAVRTQTLPTHSDVLDLLAHGGLIAILLWAYTVWRLLAIGWKALRVVSTGLPGSDRADDALDLRPWRWLFVAALVQLCAIVTYAFNPLLHRPAHGVLIWSIAGVMWALHRHLTDGQRKPALRPSPARRHALA